MMATVKLTVIGLLAASSFAAPAVAEQLNYRVLFWDEIYSGICTSKYGM